MPPTRKPRNPDLGRDMPQTRPDTLGERGEEVPAGGGFTPTADGGNPQHPVHDEDEEDMMPEDYERAIDGIDGAELDEDEETGDETTH